MPNQNILRAVNLLLLVLMTFAGNQRDSRYQQRDDYDAERVSRTRRARYRSSDTGAQERTIQREDRRPYRTMNPEYVVDRNRQQIILEMSRKKTELVVAKSQLKEFQAKHALGNTRLSKLERSIEQMKKAYYEQKDYCREREEAILKEIHLIEEQEIASKKFNERGIDRAKRELTALRKDCQTFFEQSKRRLRRKDEEATEVKRYLQKTELDYNNFYSKDYKELKIVYFRLEQELKVKEEQSRKTPKNEDSKDLYKRYKQQKMKEERDKQSIINKERLRPRRRPRDIEDWEWKPNWQDFKGRRFGRKDFPLLVFQDWEDEDQKVPENVAEARINRLLLEKRAQTQQLYLERRRNEEECRRKAKRQTHQAQPAQLLQSEREMRESGFINNQLPRQ